MILNMPMVILSPWVRKKQVWCRRWDSNPHWRAPKARASALGYAGLPRPHQVSVSAWQFGHRIRKFSNLLSQWSPLM